MQKRFVLSTAVVAIASLLLVGTTVSPAEAAVVTVGPSDCSANAVNSAISSAQDGDTVRLTCTGSVTWTSLVSIPSSKGVTLLVDGATNTPKASAVFPLTVISNQPIAITMAIGPSHAISRISGFRFAPNSGTADPFIKVTGRGMGTSGLGGFRLDNNYFDTISGSRMVAIWSDQGDLYGAIDNNTFRNTWRRNDPSYGPYNIQIWNYWHPSGSNQCWGCDGWTGNFAYGDVNSVFIEDNLFEHTSNAPGHMRHYISSELGARYVSRYNTFLNNFPDNNADLHDAHGLCIVSSNGVGARGGEIYANTISGSGFNRALQIRGGSWLIYDNVITSGHDIEFNEYRAESGGCDTTNKLGLMPPWPVPPGAQWAATAPWLAKVTNGSAWPLPQQVFNTYVWNNRTPSGALISPAVPTSLERTYIQEGRDYFSGASRPSSISSYKPYTYPHPLRGGAGAATPPRAPTAFQATGL
ncbi:MAG: hypothetical protein IT170_18895 [Bryobacterales bacterium]|nr:hypothetical protein [Bryobacterales bacterium]